LVFPDVLSAAETELEALRLASFAFQDNHGVSGATRLYWNGIARRMRSLVEQGQAEQALEVRCCSTYRDRRCGQLLASIWSFGEGGHYIRWQSRTSPTRRQIVLLQAMQQQEQGMPNVAKATEALADVEVSDHDSCLEAPSSTEGFTKVTCSRHGYVDLPDMWLRSEAVSTRRTANIDVAGAVPE